MPTPSGKKSAGEIREEKARTLAIATDDLSRRVASLADAVQTNNSVIAEFRAELSKKPDDVEVKVISGMASAERQYHLKWALKWAIITAVVAAIISGVVTFTIANWFAAKRCEINAANINTIVEVLESVDNPNLQSAIDDLNSNRNKC